MRNAASATQRGIFGYRGETLARMGLTDLAALAEPGELIWFCDTHKPAKHFADARAGLMINRIAERLLSCRHALTEREQIRVSESFAASAAKSARRASSAADPHLHTQLHTSE